MSISPFDQFPEVDFVPKSVEMLLSELISDYEQAWFDVTGEQKTLESATPERIYLYTEALRFYAAYQMIDRGCKMNLLKYSEGDYLDNLAAMLGEARLPAQRAITKLRFTLSAPCIEDVRIPKGTRSSTSSKIYFQTAEELVIPVGDLCGKCTAVALEAGVKASGLLVGQINILVDPVPYVSSVINTEISQGGVDLEGDDGLRLRIYQRPKSFSVAGPLEAYEYFARAFSQAVESVGISSPLPGEVDIRITLQGGELPNKSFTDALGTWLKNKRPLTDKVSISPPTVREYMVDCVFYVARSDLPRQDPIVTAVNVATEQYIKWQGGKIGRDLTPDKLTALLISSGAKRLELTAPVYERINGDSVCRCTNCNVRFGGIEDD